MNANSGESRRDEFSDASAFAKATARQVREGRCARKQTGWINLFGT